MIRDSETGDNWSMSKASQITLRLLSQVLGNHILPHILPFIHENLTSSNIQAQGAALSCLAAILEGPEQSALIQVIQAFTGLLSNILSSEHIKVRETGAQAVSQLCLLHHQALLEIGQVQLVLQVLILNLRSQDVVVVYNCCWGISSLVEACHHELDVRSSYLPCLETLFWLTDPDLPKQGNVLQVGYETLTVVLRFCPAASSSSPGLEQALQIILSRIMKGDNAGMASQSYVFQALESIVDEVDIETLSNNAESILYYSCCILWSESRYKDDVVSVLGKMLARLSSQFLPHAPQILTLLSGCLSTPGDISLTQGALGLIGDIYRSLSENLFNLQHDPNNVITLILNLLKDQNVSSELKPSCFGTLSDVINHVQGEIQPFLHPILAVLGEAGIACVQTPEEKESEGVCNELTKNVLDTFSSLIQTLESEPWFREAFSEQYLRKLLDFIQLCGNYYKDSEDTFASLCGLTGDIIKFINDTDIDVDQTGIKDIIEKGLASRWSRVRKIAKWAKNQTIPVGSSEVVKKARLLGSGLQVQTSGSGLPDQTFFMKVTLSCSGQYITQHIEEESVTVFLKPAVKTAEEDSTNISATVRLPARRSPEIIYTPVNHPPEMINEIQDISQLRRLRKKRVAVISDERSKRSRDMEALW